MKSELTIHREALIHVLQMAYSGEKAAGYAYNHHWRSLRSRSEVAGIRKIELEEWEHRRIVGTMLAELGSRPRLWRELMMACIGQTVGASCYVIGWFLPMYFAGRLEHANVDEYEVAAEHAEELGLSDYARSLRRLSAVEREHEVFFLQMVEDHKFLPLLNRIFGWGRKEVLEDSGCQLDQVRIASAPANGCWLRRTFFQS